LVDECFGRELSRRSLDDLKLATSELVDNAYVHGQGQIRLRLQRGADNVRIEVMDEGQGASIRIRQSAGGLGGNGLRLIDHLCQGWGALEGSTHVWAELPVQSHSAS
jgi:anti-sigma regulatory factor (Ser/Thr protein kinase)